jgi:membrane-associated protease RseP (regulator of RpoE activity)
LTISILRASVLALALSVPGSAVLAQRTLGWIGIGFEVKAESGAGAAAALVTEVSEGSPAQGAGIQVGDRLLTINGVSTAQNFANLAERLALRVGDRVQIHLERSGRRLDLSLRAGERPSDFATWTPGPATPREAVADEMFRAMDSLRIHILTTMRGAIQAAPPPPDAPRTRFIADPAAVPAPPAPADAPFEFFVFRGERHDSLRAEMEALNRRIENLREQERRISERRRVRTTSRADLQSLDAQLAELSESLEEITFESAALRAAMAEAARATAGLQYAPATPGTPPEAMFRPLTPYLLGSNRVAGAEVVDIRPGLAEYFRVETGVLVVDVAPGTPTAIAGIQPGDVIVQLDRVQVRTVDELRTGISRAPDVLPVTLVRRGVRVEVLLRRS